MDFSANGDEFSAPCLLIESSQVEDVHSSQGMGTDPLQLRFINEEITSEVCLKGAIDRTKRLGKASIQIINALSGSVSSNNKQSGSNDNTSNNNNNNSQRSAGQAQTSTTRPGNSGASGGDGGDDSDGRGQERKSEPDTCNESTEHSEESVLSSIPDLIPAGEKDASSKSTLTKTTPNQLDESFSSDSNPSIRLTGSISSSSTSSTEPVGHLETASQVSTALADEVYQSRLESSEEVVMQPLNKKSSSSASVGKSKSDTSSSSIYPASSAGSLTPSSLSSDTSQSHHCQVPDTIKDNEEQEDKICSQDLFADKEESNVMSSQEVSRISTPKDRSTPVESNDIKAQSTSLYKKVLTRTSTPLLGSQDCQMPNNEVFNCLQLSGSSNSDYAKNDVSHGSFIDAPLISPSSPTEQVHKYTSVTTTRSSSSSESVITPSPNSFLTRRTALSKSPEESSQSFQHSEHTTSSDNHVIRSASTVESQGSIINPSPDSFHCRPSALSSTPDEGEIPLSKSIDKAANNEEFVGLPKWQKDLLPKQKATSITSMYNPAGNTSTGSSYDESNIRERQSHPWQSVITDSSKSDLTEFSGNPTTAKRVTFLLDRSPSPPCVSQEQNIMQSEPQDDSFSPSSLIVDEQNGFAKLISPYKNQKNSGCSQPELSEDLFCVGTMNTQETLNDGNRVVEDNQQKLSTESKGEQTDFFDLHLTQSQCPDSPTFPRIAETVLDVPRQQCLTSAGIYEGTSTNATSSTEVSSNPEVLVAERTEQPLQPLESVLMQQDNIPVEDESITTGTYKSITQNASVELPESMKDISAEEQKQEKAKNSCGSAMPLLSSEVSTESLTGFHFSLPPTIGEVLVASTHTTPPPLCTWVQPVSEASHRGNHSSDSDMTFPSHQPPSLTHSMPRQDSPDSEPAGLPLAINEPSTSTDPLPPTMQPAELSVFALARNEANRPRVQQHQNIQENTLYDPFLFSSEDDIRPPVSRRQKSQPLRGNVNKTSRNLQQQSEVISHQAAFVNTTTIRTVKTVTTQVRRYFTIVTTKEDSDAVVETVEYEEKEEPFVEEKVDEKVTVERIVETGNCAYVRQPPPPVVEELPRISPRRKRRHEKTKSPEPSNSKEPRLDTRRQPKRRSKTATKDKISRNVNDESKQKNDIVPEGSREASSEGRHEKKITVIPAPPKIINNTADAQKTPPTPNGTRVFARWSDGFYYPGTVIGIAEFTNGRCYEVRFDDGDKRKIRPHQLIVCDSLENGLSVLAQGPDGYFDHGTVIGRFSTPTDKGYEVELKKSKEVKRYLRKFVILSEKHVNRLQTTRSNCSNGSTYEFSSLYASSAESKSRDTSAKDTSNSSREIADMVDDETPKSTRKTNKRNRKRKRRNLTGGTSGEGSDEAINKKKPKRVKRDLLKKPSEPTRRSPRKKHQNDEVPPNDTLFAGFAFLITGSHNTSDSESELEEFNRAQTEQYIEAGGGVILKDFSETQNTVADRCFLISNTYCRTVKYFQCLANGIPLVSHLWIQDCSLSNQLKDHKNYLLPAGKSLETGEIVECKARTNQLFDELNVYVHGCSSFKSTWHSVLKAAGANIVTKPANRPGRAQINLDELCSVVISEDSSLPQSLRYTCEQLDIPVVGLEWLCQCLINCSVVHVDGHPEYDYKHITNNSSDDVK